MYLILPTFSAFLQKNPFHMKIIKHVPFPHPEKGNKGGSINVIGKSFWKLLHKGISCWWFFKRWRNVWQGLKSVAKAPASLHSKRILHERTVKWTLHKLAPVTGIKAFALIELDPLQLSSQVTKYQQIDHYWRKIGVILGDSDRKK